MKIFDFPDAESFKGPISACFAKLLLSATAETRNRIRRSFGIKIEVSTDPIRTTHDGQRIGIGAFTTSSEEIQFQIGPKVAFRVLDLLSALRELSKENEPLKLVDREGVSTVKQSYSDFIPSF